MKSSTSGLLMSSRFYNHSLASKSLASTSRQDPLSKRCSLPERQSPRDFGESINIDVNNMRAKLLTSKRLQGSRSRSKSQPKKGVSPKRKPKAKKGKPIEIFESKSEAVRRLAEELQECKSRIAK